MEAGRLRYLCIEIYKTINSSNRKKMNGPSFQKVLWQDLIGLYFNTEKRFFLEVSFLKPTERA